MSEIISFLFICLVITPLQSAIVDRLEGFSQSSEIARAGYACASTAVPQLRERAQNDPIWAISTGIGVGIGAVSLSRLLEGQGTACQQVADLLKKDSKPRRSSETEAI